MTEPQIGTPLEVAVADAVRSGGRVESQVGGTVVIVQRTPFAWWEHGIFLLALVGVVALFPRTVLLWLLVIAVWAWATLTRKARWQLSAGADGQVTRERLKR